MMKKLIFFLVSNLFLIQIYAQAPDIEWQKSLGGSNHDYATSIQQTTDGGYIVAGYSGSIDGDVTGHLGSTGSYDYWIVKLNSSGSIQWQKSLGGSENDYANSIQQTTDGGYIVAGRSISNDGDVTGHHGSTGFYDYWIVKLNSTGNIQWQKSLGGSDSDYANSIQQTTDGGYIVAGYSFSTNGDITGNHGNSDVWIVKLNSTGNIQWQKSLGGSENDYANSIQLTTDGGYIVAGYSYSNDGDVTGNHGNSDVWIIKLNSTGNIQWQKSLGGSYFDFADSIQQTTDGGYIVSGSSASNDGDVTGHHGSTGFYDYWIVKLNSAGNIQWQKSFGGGDTDYTYSIQQTTDEGYIVAGTSGSNDGDVTGHHGDSGDYFDYWIVKLDSTGNIQWQKSLGGSDSDAAQSIQQTTDGGYIVAGFSYSTNGDVTGNHGYEDYWIVKLKGDSFQITTSSSPAAGGATTGGGIYVSGTSVTVSATPANGYTFQKWTENGTTVSTNSNYTFTVNTDRVLKAVFKKKNPEITLTSDPAEGGTTFGAGTYPIGTNVSVGAIANTGYSFVNWTEDGVEVSTDAVYIFTISTSRDLVAHFKLPSFNISANPNNSQGGTALGGGIYNEGEEVSLTAITNMGYTFNGWKENGTLVSANPVYTFTANADRDLIADFGICGGEAINYTITTKSSPVAGGTTTGAGTYAEGSTATVIATANAGYTFKNWTENGAVVSTDATYSFTVNGDRNLVAKFKAGGGTVNYTITTKSAPAAGGTTTGDGVYNYDKKVTLKAVANSGYVFVNWTIGNTVVSTTKNYKHTVTGNATVKANFEKMSYTITTKSAPAAGGTTTGDGVYNYDSKVTLKAVPNSGYVFVNWTIGNTVVSTTKNYKHTVTGNATIKAKFVKAGALPGEEAKSATPEANPSEFTIYPNPFNESLNVKIDKGQIKELMIYDFSGRLIMTQKGNDGEQYQLNTQNLVKGQYILKVVTEDEVKSFKVIKN